MRDPIAGSVAWVTGWLAKRFGGATRPRRQGRSYRWQVIREPRHRNIEIAISVGAIARGRDWITSNLERITAHADDRPPTPPAYYSLSSRGATIRGLKDVVFDVAGQVVRCEQERDMRGTASLDALSEGMWRIIVDDTDRGPAFPIEDGETGEDVMKRALQYVRNAGWVRLPPQPWSWSVLDPAGREWWGRLEKRMDAPGKPRRLASHLVLKQRPVGPEIELAWASARPPRPAALRRIVAVIARPVV